MGLHCFPQSVGCFLCIQPIVQYECAMWLACVAMMFNASHADMILHAVHAVWLVHYQT